MSETSMNPNVPVGAEPTSANKANSSTSFDEITETIDAANKKPKKAKDAREVKAEPKKNQKGGTGFDDIPDDEPEADDEPDEKAAAKKDLKKPDEKDPKAKEAKDKEGEKPKGKPKAAKFKAGDQEYSVPGDAVISIPVNGEPVEFTMQELQSEVSGKTNWAKKNQELHNKETAHSKTVESMNSLINTILAKSKEDPEEMVDFLADMTKQDSVALKSATLRQNFEALLPVFEMDPGEREAWFKDRERDWRDRAHARREKTDKDTQEKQVTTAKRAEVAQRYGLDDKEYEAAEGIVAKYLKHQDPDFDGKVSPEDVAACSRHMMALHTIGQVVPHLEKHPKFDAIVEDIVNDLVKNPSMNRDKLAALLEDIWAKPGDDNKGLKDLGRKAQKHAQTTDDPPARRTPSKEPTFFDDIE